MKTKVDRATAAPLARAAPAVGAECPAASGLDRSPRNVAQGQRLDAAFGPAGRGPARFIPPASSGMHAGPNVQRKVSIEEGYYLDRLRKPGNRFKNQVVGAFNDLLNGTGVTAAETSNVVGLQGEPKDEHDPRFILLHDLVGDPRTVTIRKDTKGDNRTDVVAAGGEDTRSAIARAATTGADAVVHYDPDTPEPKRMIEVVTEGGIALQPMPAFLILAHELIHAGRILRGRAASDPGTAERHVTVYRGPQGKPEIGHTEEIETVGLAALSAEELEQALESGGHLQAFEKSDKAARLLKTAEDLRNNPQAVTENALREALGMPPRARYETVKQDALKAKGGQISLDRLDALGRSAGLRIPWAALAAASIPVLGWLLWRYGATLLTGPDGDAADASPLQQKPSTSPMDTRVVQAFGISDKDRKWPEATSVHVLRAGVYEVRKDAKEALVVKTSADAPSPIYEAVGAQVGTMLGVNTVRTEALRIQSDEIQNALAHFRTLGSGGQALAQAIAASRHEHLLVMPFLEGKDLKDSAKEWSAAQPAAQKGWVKELGKVWLLDLVIQNPDRHPENLRLGSEGGLFSIDQVVGPSASQTFAAEKVEAALRDLQATKKMFFLKLNSGLEGFRLEWDEFHQDFDEGVAEARRRLEGISAKDIGAVFDIVAKAKTQTPLAGIEPALALIKRAIPLS